MNKSSISVCLALLKRDLRVFRKEWFGKFIDSIFLMATNIIIFAYFMPLMGLKQDYGVFFLIGSIAAYGFFDVISKITTLIADIKGDRLISYNLTLPMSTTMSFIYIASYWALNSAILTAMLFPIGKVILFNQWDFSIISYPKLLIFYPTIHLFYAFFALWLTATIKQISQVSRVWLRVVNPIFMFGGFFYSWQTAFTLSPTVGYLLLINPMVYILEGMRAVCLGQDGFLPFQYSFLALWGFIIFFGVDAIRRLRKILDCI